MTQTNAFLSPTLSSPTASPSASPSISPSASPPDVFVMPSPTILAMPAPNALSPTSSLLNPHRPFDSNSFRQAEQRRASTDHLSLPPSCQSTPQSKVKVLTEAKGHKPHNLSSTSLLSSSSSSAASPGSLPASPGSLPASPGLLPASPGSSATSSSSSVVSPGSSVSAHPAVPSNSLASPNSLLPLIQGACSPEQKALFKKATDGSLVENLAQGIRASAANFYRFSKESKSVAIRHKTVSENWLCVQGSGVLVISNPSKPHNYSSSSDSLESRYTRYRLQPNSFCSIPTRRIFYWEQTSEEDLIIFGITLGPWPQGEKGNTEAEVVNDKKIIAEMKKLANDNKDLPPSVIKVKKLADGVRVIENESKSPLSKLVLCELDPNKETKLDCYPHLPTEKLIYVRQGELTIQLLDSKYPHARAPRERKLIAGNSIRVPQNISCVYKNNTSNTVKAFVCSTPLNSPAERSPLPRIKKSPVLPATSLPGPKNLSLPLPANSPLPTRPRNLSPLPPEISSGRSPLPTRPSNTLVSPSRIPSTLFAANNAPDKQLTAAQKKTAIIAQYPTNTLT